MSHNAVIPWNRTNEAAPPDLEYQKYANGIVTHKNNTQMFWTSLTVWVKEEEKMCL